MTDTSKFGDYLTKDQQWLMEHAIECDGAEIPETWWGDADVLKELGLAIVSPPHGPGRQFKRIEPVMKPVYELREDEGE